jgi:hypothetical protein
MAAHEEPFHGRCRPWRSCNYAGVDLRMAGETVLEPVEMLIAAERLSDAEMAALALAGLIKKDPTAHMPADYRAIAAAAAGVAHRLQIWAAQLAALQLSTNSTTTRTMSAGTPYALSKRRLAAAGLPRFNGSKTKAYSKRGARSPS